VTGYEFTLGVLIDGPLQIDTASVCNGPCSVLRLQDATSGLVIFVPPNIGAGNRPFTVTLPDGTTLAGTVAVAAAPAAPPAPTASLASAALHLIRIVPNDPRYPGTVTNVTGYEYGLGVPVDGPLQVQAPCVPQCSWMRVDTTEAAVVFFVPPSIPAGTYSFTVVLPNGVRLSGGIVR
jgi:hypothetical protein